MRELKFRAWDSEEDCFHYFDMNGGCKQFDRISCELYKLGYFQQYTGLKDKNGKEIYEGDICKSIGNIYFEVIYNKTNAQFQRKWIGESGVKLRQFEFEEFAKNTYITSEVIGNLYENSELLK